MILTCAIAGKADELLTFNLRLFEGLATGGVRILAP